MVDFGLVFCFMNLENNIKFLFVFLGIRLKKFFRICFIILFRLE